MDIWRVITALWDGKQITECMQQYGIALLQATDRVDAYAVTAWAWENPIMETPVPEQKSVKLLIFSDIIQTTFISETVKEEKPFMNVFNLFYEVILIMVRKFLMDMSHCMYKHYFNMEYFWIVSHFLSLFVLSY